MTPRWRWVGDRALLRTFGDAKVADANRSALGCRDLVAGLGESTVEDVVPGARSVLVVLRPGATPSPGILDVLERDSFPPSGGAGRSFEIPVRYGGDDGPDLGDVARLHGVTMQRVIRRHCAVEYIVGFIGFSPGFPYLLGLDPALATPRLDTPRVKVPAGSVGIGGPYTGIYPGSTPGGWRLIGRADVMLFDPMREPPALLAPGDRVRFVER